jgi:polyphosphate glucokinase
MHILGIDIGGSGVKGAPVDVTTGELLAERFRLPTPQPATPKATMKTIQEIVAHFGWHGPIGCGYPGVIKHGFVHTAANVDESWIGFSLKNAIQDLTSQEVQVVNDADAAGIAEMYFGAGKAQLGMVVMVTLGTGIGVAAFIDGKLIPNLELGHIEIKGEDAEHRAAEAAKEREDLDWKDWAKRVDRFLYRLERLIWPDLYIIGGGVSKDWDQFVPYFKKVNVPVVPAMLRNNAGIVGAAMSVVYEHDLPLSPNPAP